MTDLLLVIPKRDELRAAGAVFDFLPAEPDRKLNDTYESWEVALGDLTGLVVLADAQDSTALALATKAGLDEYDPAVALCLGTAAGREGKVDYLDVVLATTVLDASEWRKLPGKWEPQWHALPDPPGEVRYDIDAFSKDNTWHEECGQYLDKALGQTQENRPNGFPRLHDAWVVTTAILHQDAEFLGEIWALHSRLRAVDMETAGFVKACQEGVQRTLWFVVRSVSDYGTLESKQDQLRPAAAAAAAAVSRSLIERGLQRSHPVKVAPREDQDQTLSSENFFARLTMTAFLGGELPRRFGVTLDPHAFTPGLTVHDLAALCGRGKNLDEVEAELDAIREEYFTRKYIDYDDQADVRSRTNAWVEDVHAAFGFLGVVPENAQVLYVGVGTGRDLAAVVPRFRTLTGVDLSQAMLQKAKVRQPAMHVVQGRAEALRNLDDESVDLYLSLRTYQSSLFDRSEALRQAHRVLRPNGNLVISLPGGFLDHDEETGELRYVPGLLIPGTKVVDRRLPRRMANDILSQLENLMFERIGFHQRETDLYVYARKRAVTS